MKKESSFHFSFEEYIKDAEAFHGFAAPGLLVGGFMVSKAMRHFPPGVLYEALCETSKCLPDAIQLLTPCTIGNGRLRIISLGRFALSLFNKDTGSGVRVFPNPAKVESWLELKAWYMKLKTKHEQDLNLLISQIKQAGEEILEQQPIQDQAGGLQEDQPGANGPLSCLQGDFPAATGRSCLACQGESPYVA